MEKWKSWEVEQVDRGDVIKNAKGCRASELCPKRSVNYLRIRI